jgi:MFS family permease
MTEPQQFDPELEAVLPALSLRRTRLIMVAIVVTVLFASMDLMVVNVAMYAIIKQFDPLHGVSDSRWILTVYTLALATTQPIYGKLSDAVGGKRVILVAMAFFMIGSTLCALSQNMSQLIVFRGLQGIGAGGLLSVATVLAGQISEPRLRAKYAGYAGGVSLFGFIVGPLVGGFFSDTHHVLGLTIDWRGAFVLNLPFGLLATVLLVTLLPNFVVRRSSGIDFPGAALAVLGITALLLVTLWGGSTYSWGSAPVLGMCAATLVLGFLFFRQERRASDPIIPPWLFSNAAFRSAVPVSVIAGFAMMGTSYYVALYLRLVRGYAPLATCLHLLPLILGMLAGLFFAGAVIAVRERYKIFPIVGAALAAVGAALCATVQADTSSWLLSLYLLLFGIGIGQLTQVPLASVQNSVAVRDLAPATIAVVFVRMIGQSLGPAVFGTILTAIYTNALPAAIAKLPGVSEQSGVPSPALTDYLPVAAQHAITNAFVNGIHGVFLASAVGLVVASVYACFYKEPPLRPEVAAAVRQREAKLAESRAAKARR